MKGLPISCGENRFCLSSLFGALGFCFRGFSICSILLYTSTHDNVDCLGFSGFLGLLGLLSTKPPNKKPLPQKHPNHGKRKVYVLISQEKKNESY